jgi:hypothetical protein
MLFVSANESPDDGFVTYLRESLVPYAETMVVLADLHRLRSAKKFDAGAVKRRLDDWRSRCQQGGVDRSYIVEFDHANRTQSLDGRFRDDTQRWLPAECTNVPLEDIDRLCVAGKFPAAAESIRQAVAEAIDTAGDASGDNAEESRLDRLQTELRELYRANGDPQTPLLLRFAPASVLKGTSYATNLLGKVPGVSQYMNYSLQPFQQAWSILAFCNRVVAALPNSAAWGAAGGALGLTAILAGCMVALPPLAIWPALASMPVASAALAAAVGAYHRLKMPDDGEPGIPAELVPKTPAAHIDRLFRGGLLCALIAELAGSSEHQLLRSMQKLLEPLDCMQYQTQAEVNEALTRVRHGLDSLQQETLDDN